MVHRIYVGSYSNEIYSLSFDPDAASLTLESTLTVGFHPSWLTPLPSDPTVILAGLEQTDGQIVAVKYNQKGQGTLVGSAPSGGADPCTLLATNTELLIGNVRPWPFAVHNLLTRYFSTHLASLPRSR